MSLRKKGPQLKGEPRKESKISPEMRDSITNVKRIVSTFAAMYLKPIQKACTAKFDFGEKQYYLIDGYRTLGDFSDMSGENIHGVEVTTYMWRAINRSQDERNPICDAIIDHLSAKLLEQKVTLQTNEDKLLALFFVTEKDVNQRMFSDEVFSRKFSVWNAISTSAGGAVLKKYSKDFDLPSFSAALRKLYPQWDFTTMDVYTEIHSQKGIDTMSKFLQVYDAAISGKVDDPTIIDAIAFCTFICQKNHAVFEMYGIPPAKYVEMAERAKAVASVRPSFEIVNSQKLQKPGQRGPQVTSQNFTKEFENLKKLMTQKTETHTTGAATPDGGNAGANPRPAEREDPPNLEEKVIKVPDGFVAVPVAGTTYFVKTEEVELQALLSAMTTPPVSGVKVQKAAGGTLTFNEAGLSVLKVASNFKVSLAASRK